MAQILLEAWDHSPPLRHGAWTHSRPRRWSHPRSEVFFNVWLAVGPSLVGSIVFLIGRDTRVSLTFRKTLAGPCSCPFPEFCSRTKYSRLKSQTKLIKLSRQSITNHCGCGCKQHFEFMKNTLKIMYRIAPSPKASSDFLDKLAEKAAQLETKLVHQVETLSLSL